VLLPDFAGSGLFTFAVGTIFLVLGMVLYSVGIDGGLQPIGGFLGNYLSSRKSPAPLLIVGLLAGIIITASEPDLSVLAAQVSAFDKYALIFSIAAGVGTFLVLALLRIIFKLDLRLVLLIGYALIFVLAAFAPKDMIPLGFDTGGVTTGPMTVPFLMAFSMSVAGTIGGRDSEDSSFGMIAICSVGPIVAFFVLALIVQPEGASAVYESIPEGIGAEGLAVGNKILHTMGETAIAIAPIAALFAVFQAFLKLPAVRFASVLVNCVYVFVGLTLFLTGVSAAFLPLGYALGNALGSVNPFLLIPLCVATGACIIIAEPAVHVLAKQVENITSGAVRGKTLILFLTLGNILAGVLAAVRAATGLSIWVFIAPFYALAFLCSFLAPKLFAAIAFDSGGVASGPMTASFLIPLMAGGATAAGGDAVTDAFGTVALVALMPILVISLVGVYTKLHSHRFELRMGEYVQALISMEGSIIEWND
jgi:hypothetical protein